MEGKTCSWKRKLFCSYTLTHSLLLYACIYIYIFLYIFRILFHSQSLFLTRSTQLILAHTHSTTLVTDIHSFVRKYTKLYIRVCVYIYIYIYIYIYYIIYIYIYISRYMVSIRSNSQCVLSPYWRTILLAFSGAFGGASDGEQLPCFK